MELIRRADQSVSVRGPPRLVRVQGRMRRTTWPRSRSAS